MILNYFDLTAAFNLEPAEAIEYFQGKGLTPTFSYLDLVGEEHDAAFTVAKMMDTDLLGTVKGKLDDALANGETLEDFKRTLIPQLQKAGWWGKKDLIDPLTGRLVESQLGSASRLETIFRTNLQSAYAAGHWEKVQTNAQEAPYLLYDAVDDAATRPEHAQWDGTLLPVGSPFWDTHYPLNGYNCRCGVIQVDEDELAEYGLSPSAEPNLQKQLWTNPRTGQSLMVPQGVDPQFAHNAGKARIEKLKALEAEKAAALAAEEAQALANAAPSLEKAKLAGRIQAQANKALKELQEAQVQGAFATQKAKVQQRAAQHQIDQAVADKTPYLAVQIKNIAKTKAGQNMTPLELLEKAKEKAALEKQSVDLISYKNAAIAGKEPKPNALAAYQALDANKKAEIDQEIEVKSGNYQAKLQLDEYKTGAGYSYEKKAIKKLSNQGALDGLDAKAQVKAINQAAAAQKLKDQQAKAVKGYEKNLLAGKTPTDNQLEAVKALPGPELAKLMAGIKKAKQDQPEATAKPPQGDGPNMDELTQVGPREGSNPGGSFVDNTTGLEWYIKNPGDMDNAKNEVLTGKLYKLAGAEGPDMEVVTHNGKPGIASKKVPGLEIEEELLKAGKVKNVNEHFAIDAWLANWDVVGLEYDNLKVGKGRAVRLDTGGGLRYRAQGQLKGDAFGNKVIELETLRDPGINPQAAAVFKNVTDQDIKQGVERIASITESQIDELVDLYGPAGAAQKKALGDTLKARRVDLIQRFLADAPAKPPGKTSAKYKQAQAIAREEAIEAGTAAVSDANAKLLTAIKGIGKQANEGAPIRTIDQERVAEAVAAVDAIKALPLTAAHRNELLSVYESWTRDLQNAIKATGPAKWETGNFEPPKFKASGIADDQLTVDLSVLDRPKVPTRAVVDNLMEKTIGTTTGSSGVSASQQAGRQAENLKNIPDHLQDLIATYTASYYQDINPPLFKKTASADHLKLADALSLALSMGKPYIGKSARGMNLEGDVLDRWKAGMSRAQEEGKPVRLLAFTSSTRGPKAAFDGNTVIRINGKNGVHVNEISHHKGREDEVIFKHNSDFMVESVDTDSNGRTVFTLTEVDEQTVDNELRFSEE